MKSNQIQLKSTGKYVDCQELVRLDKKHDYDRRDGNHNSGLSVDLRNLQLDSLVHLLNQPDSSYRGAEQNATDHWELRNMSATTESATNGGTAKSKLKPVAKRSSLDANTVPARRSTSGVYQLIKPKRTSLDSPVGLPTATNSLLASPDSKLDTNNNLSSSGLKPNSSSATRSSPSSTLLSTPKFDTKFDTKDSLSTTTSSQSTAKSPSSTSSSAGDHLNANGETKRRLSIDKKSLNGISEDELNCAFQLLDINSDGSISKQELKEMLLSLNIHADDSLVDQMIMEVTKNGRFLIKTFYCEKIHKFRSKIIEEKAF